MKVIQFISQLIIPIFVFFTIIYGFLKKVRIYDSFVNGAKDGINIIIRIFPYILAIFVGIKTFQTSGVFEFTKELLSSFFSFFGVPTEVFYIAIVKPLSGSASTAIFTDIVKTTGPDSLASRISAVIMGSAETTFYVLSVYLGAVGIKKTRYLIPVCIISDVAGIIIAIVIVKIFFG